MRTRNNTQDETSTHRSVILPAQRMTPDDAHYFFAYFDKCPWSPDGRHLLTHRVGFNDRQPTADDVSEVGMVDLENGPGFRKVAETHAWCWQLGSQLQWLHGPDTGGLIYNARREGRFIAVALTPDSGEERVLPAPVYPLSPDGRWAATCNYARLAVTRPGYGYEGIPDPWSAEPHPANDGVYRMDLDTGEIRLLVSLDRLARFEPHVAGMEYGKHWVNHLVISPDSRRLMFLHRWFKPPGPGRRWGTRMFTIGSEGEDLYLLNDNDMTSHMAWFAPDRIIAYAHRDHPGYYEFTDRTPDVVEIGAGRFSGDGHCSYSPDSQWMLTDTVPDPETRERTLILYRLRDGTRFDIGKFYHEPRITGPFRCDLHPRWNRAGDQVCFDSIHEGFRGVYVMDLRAFREHHR